MQQRISLVDVCEMDFQSVKAVYNLTVDILWVSASKPQNHEHLDIVRVLKNTWINPMHRPMSVTSLCRKVACSQCIVTVPMSAWTACTFRNFWELLLEPAVS